MIEAAHVGRPEAPSYEAAEEFMGMREAADGSLIDPALSLHVAKRRSAQAEVLRQNRLAQEEKRFVGGYGRPGNEDAEGGRTGKPKKPKGDGKGKDGDP